VPTVVSISWPARCLQPFLDQADDPSLAHSVLDELYEPFTAHSIEMPIYVGL